MTKYVISTIHFFLKFPNFNSIKVFLSYRFSFSKQNIFFNTEKQKIFLRTRSSDIGQLIIIYSGLEYDDIFQSMYIKNKINIIDIGWNIWLFTLYCDRYFWINDSIVFEPDNNNFKLMEKNLTNNNISWKFYKKALYKSKGIVYFNDNLRDDSKKIDLNGNVIVETLTIKDIIEENKIYDILKIDIEWGERNILVEEHKEIYLKCKYIILEYHLRDSKNKVNDIINYFDWFNHKIKIINTELWIILFTNKLNNV